MRTSADHDPKSTDVSSVITDLAIAINEGLGVRDVQCLVVEKAAAALSGASASVMMPGGEPDKLCVVATTATGDVGAGTPPESPVAEWVMRHDEPLLLMGRSGPLAHLLHREDIRDAVCVPLRYAGRAIGALSVSNSKGREPFGERDVELLTSIGHLAAVALRNTMLYNEASEHRERLRAVLHQLWKAQEDERRRVAADLHDGPAQGLFRIVFRVQTARKQVESDPAQALPALLQTEGAARETLAQLRAIMAGLHPMSLDDLGLVPALRSECAAVKARGRVNVKMVVSGGQRRLDSALETGLYQMAREALSNAERHSGSSEVRVSVKFEPDGVAIAVDDRGSGFEPETLREARMNGHMGLVAMRERAEALGIAISTVSKAGKGTRISLRCPRDDSKDGCPNAAVADN